MSRRIGSSYLAHDVIGRGASGTVWRGAGPDGPVAIKVLRPELAGDEEIVARFLRERSLLTRLRHPHLVAVRDLVAEGDTLALILDLVDGPTLRARLDRSGALPPDEAAETVAGVSEALRAIHDAGVVHRDVKPENVLLAAAGHGTRPMLTDLGVALLAGGGRLTAAPGLVGTPDYVAPETISGARPTPAADVYAAGVLLYELLAGRTPFGADHPATVLYQQVHAEPEPIPDVPAVLWALISRCLAKQPLDRPSSAELASALRGAVPGLRAGVTHVPGVSGTRLPWAVPGAVPACAVLESATPASSQATHLGRPRLLPDPPEPPEPPAARRRPRRWPYALAALGTGLLAFAAPQLYDDREVTYRADTGWICAHWPAGDGATAGVRPCVLARAGSVRAAVQVRTDAPGVDVELHLVRLGEPATVVVSGRCRPPGERTAGCGTLRHPLDGRYVAVATAGGGIPAATPPVSR